MRPLALWLTLGAVTTDDCAWHRAQPCSVLVAWESGRGRLPGLPWQVAQDSRPATLCAISGTLVDFSWHTVHFVSDPKPGRLACDTGRVATDCVRAWHSVQFAFPRVS